MSTVACDGGTKDVEDNQEFDAWCPLSQVQFFLFFKEEKVNIYSTF